MATVRGIAEALDRTMSVSVNTLTAHGGTLRQAGRISSGPHLAPHEAILLLMTAAVPVRARATAIDLAGDYLALGTVLPKLDRPEYANRTGVAGEAVATAPTLEAAVEALVAWAPAWSVLAWAFVAASHPNWETLDEDQRSAAVARYYRQPRIELHRDPFGIHVRLNPLPRLSLPGGQQPSIPGLPWMEAHPRKALPAWIANANADWQMCSTIGLVTLLTLHAELYLPRELTADELCAATVPELRHPIAEANGPASLLH